VVDELGFRAVAEPVDVTVEVARPTPPTPTPAPTRAPRPPLGEQLNGVALPLLLLIALVVAVVVAIWWRRRKPPPAGGDEMVSAPIVAAADALPADGHVAVLVWQAADGSYSEQIELTMADVTIGREQEAVDIIIDEPTISRLHARIRRTATEEYWLYDEGSAAGTFLNYERLGLAPRRLQHNDVVQLGRVTLRFRLELARPDIRAANNRPTENDL